MTANVDKTKYGLLLMETLPSVISSEKELKRLTKEVDRLITKGIKEGNLSPEEESLLELLGILIESYEDDNYQISELSPNEILKHLMSENNYKQKDIIHLFGSSGITSEVINGKRSISKTQAKRLAEFFKVSIELFI